MLRSFKIRHFRCFDAFEAEFGPGLNLIVGPNARGKTSLLEAACILLRLESSRTARLGDVIQHEKRGFVVDGYFNERHLQFYYGAHRKKLALDSVEQKSVREYLQVGRLVYFATADIELVRGSSEVRRRFLDFVAAQRDAGYRKVSRDYERALRSRNALLKAPVVRWEEVAAFDGPLLSAGSELTAMRWRLVEDLQAPVQSAHSAVSSTDETLRLEYFSAAGDSFAVSLAEARNEDLRLRQTSIGPHRDDVHFFVDGKPSRFASEGQQRTLVLALKLGAAGVLEGRFGVPPALLLDDVFGELDLGRRTGLLAALPEGAQKFVTATHLDWMPPNQDARLLQLG